MSWLGKCDHTVVGVYIPSKVYNSIETFQTWKKISSTSIITWTLKVLDINIFETHVGSLTRWLFLGDSKIFATDRPTSLSSPNKVDDVYTMKTLLEYLIRYFSHSFNFRSRTHKRELSDLPNCGDKLLWSYIAFWDIRKMGLT